MKQINPQRSILSKVFYIIPAIIIALIVLVDIFMYSGDVLLNIYIVPCILILVSAFTKKSSKRVVVVNYIVAFLCFLSFIYLKPNYTVSKARDILTNEFPSSIDFKLSGYVKEKNIFVKGTYLFSINDGDLIVFDNRSGDYYLLKK